MNASSKKDIRTLTNDELALFIKENGQASFRSKQIQEWIWKKSVGSFDEMRNVPGELIEALQKHFEFRKISLYTQQISSDRTIKCGFKLYDEHIIEGVLIPAEKRMTACVSSQVGCSLSCAFCATGKLQRERNLDAAEIYDQVVAIRSFAETKYEMPLTNIVFMGMGEPLLNYQQVLLAIQKITSPEGLGMSAERITVSTAGIAKMIMKLADDRVRFKLALSLHAANDAKRNQIMPINETNNLQVLTDALRYFYKGTGKRITLEYLMLDGFNDQLSDAKELVQFCKKLPVKVNLIEYNATGDGMFRNSQRDQVEAFRSYLEEHRVIATIRHSRGKDIDAACGQLANKHA